MRVIVSVSLALKLAAVLLLIGLIAGFALADSWPVANDAATVLVQGE